MGFVVVPAAEIADVAEADRLAARTVQNGVADFFRQSIEWRFYVKAIVFGQRHRKLEIKMAFPVPAADSARRQRKLRVGDNPLGVKELDDTQAIALRTGAHRVVEREQPWFEFGQRIGADRAGKAGGEQMLPSAVHFQRNGAAVGLA